MEETKREMEREMEKSKQHQDDLKAEHALAMAKIKMEESRQKHEAEMEDKKIDQAKIAAEKERELLKCISNLYFESSTEKEHVKLLDLLDKLSHGKPQPPKPRPQTKTNYQNKWKC